jgi:hypothetical protein
MQAVQLGFVYWLASFITLAAAFIPFLFWLVGRRLSSMHQSGVRLIFVLRQRNGELRARRHDAT